MMLLLRYLPTGQAEGNKADMYMYSLFHLDCAWAQRSWFHRDDAPRGSFFSALLALSGSNADVSFMLVCISVRINPLTKTGQPASVIKFFGYQLLQIGDEITAHRCLTLNMPRYFSRSRQSWLNDVIWRPFYLHGLTSIPTWISNYTHYKVWEEITYPFQKSSSCAVEDVEWLSNFIPHWVCMLGFKLNHVSKRAPGDRGWFGITDNYRDFVKKHW